MQLASYDIKSVSSSLGERQSQLSQNDLSNQKNYFYPTPNSNSRAVNEFFDTGKSYSLSKHAYAFPFLSSIQGGVGADLGVNIGEGNGYLTASLAHTSSDNVGVAKQRSLIASYKNQMTEAVSYGLMLGYISEGDRFLGMKGSGAFNLNGADSKTSILGTKLNFNLGEGSSLGFMAGVSSSKLNKSRDGLITGIDDVYGNSFSMKYEQYGLNKNDKFSFSLSQPHRTSSGSMDVQIAGLSNSDGTIPYENKSLGLSPSGRQLDLSLGYDRDLSSLATLSSKLNVTKDSGHSNSSWDDRSLYLGLMKKETFGADQINVGTIFYDSSDRPSFNLQYKINF